MKYLGSYLLKVIIIEKFNNYQKTKYYITAVMTYEGYTIFEMENVYQWIDKLM